MRNGIVVAANGIELAVNIHVACIEPVSGWFKLKRPDPRFVTPTSFGKAQVLRFNGVVLNIVIAMAQDGERFVFQER